MPCKHDPPVSRGTSCSLGRRPALNTANATQDADRMTSLWMPSNDVMCIHPGDEPVVGQQAVARSWRSLFRSGDNRFSSSVIKVVFTRMFLKVTLHSRIRGKWLAECDSVCRGRRGEPALEQKSWEQHAACFICSRVASPGDGCPRNILLKWRGSEGERNPSPMLCLEWVSYSRYASLGSSFSPPPVSAKSHLHESH